MEKDVPRAHHDLGGVGKFMCEAVDTAPHGLTAFDRDVDALRQVLGRKRVMTVDELRKNIEAIGPNAYDQMGYYERWIHSIAQTLIQRGVITTADLARKMDAVKKRA